MPSQFSQLVDESIYYQQDVLHDTINSAEWSCDPPAFLSNQTVGPTSTKVLFSPARPGSYVLKVLMTMVSGQILDGQARITVSDLRV